MGEGHKNSSLTILVQQLADVLLPLGTVLWYLPRTEPHVLKASIHPVAGQWLIVVQPRRAYLDACPPQAHDLPGLVHNAFLHVMHQLGAFLGITLDFLPLE